MANVQQHRLLGVVVSAGKMMKTVKVRIAKQEWNKHIRKHLPAPYHVLVSDPADSVCEGDVVALRSGWRTSRHVHHVITSIVAPFGPSLSERPPVPTEQERLAEREAKRLAKDKRQAERGRVVAKIRLKEGRRLAAALQRHPDWRERWENSGLEERKTIRDMVKKEYQEEKEKAKAAAEKNDIANADPLKRLEVTLEQSERGLAKAEARLLRAMSESLMSGPIGEIARAIKDSKEKIRRMWGPVRMLERALEVGREPEAVTGVEGVQDTRERLGVMSEVPVSPTEEIAREIKRSNKEIRRMWWPVRVIERELGIASDYHKVTKGLERLEIGVEESDRRDSIL